MKNHVSPITTLAFVMIAVALSVIAVNMTYSNVMSARASTVVEAPVQEEIVQVIGRVTEVFDGIGAEVGFLVTDGAKLRYVRYDQGSMAAQKGYEPQYIRLVRFGNGETLIDPVIVDQFR